MLARNRNIESSPVGVLPPVHVTVWTTACSPVPVAWTLRFQPGSASNESMPKPAGTVSRTLVVLAFSSSVGTASV